MERHVVSHEVYIFYSYNLQQYPNTEQTS